MVSIGVVKLNVNNNTTVIRWVKNNIIPIKYSDLYDENQEKIIHPKYMNLPINKVKYVLKGVIKSDGCIRKEISLEMTSRKVVESIRYICIRMGILTSGYSRDRIGETHQSGDKTFTCKKKSYVLRIPQN